MFAGMSLKCFGRIEAGRSFSSHASRRRVRTPSLNVDLVLDRFSASLAALGGDRGLIGCQLSVLLVRALVGRDPLLAASRYGDRSLAGRPRIGVMCLRFSRAP